MDKWYLLGPAIILVAVLDRDEDFGASGEVDALPGHGETIVVTKISTETRLGHVQERIFDSTHRTSSQGVAAGTTMRL